ncbi:MAG: hypothetical protein KDC42_05245 [Ignavibacteriae bacterium]|nr:hypothetical protein [Ignavibacteriota bacterium]
MGLGVSLHKLAMAGYGVTAGDNVLPRACESSASARSPGSIYAEGVPTKEQANGKELVIIITDIK